MTQEELNQIIECDMYCLERKRPSEAEIRLYLREVNYHCPLCGKELQSRKQKKSGVKQFEIAHIYPNRPTLFQFPALNGLERLGKNSESFENKIALCPQCHSIQDYQTTREDYLKLLNIKKKCLANTAIHDVTIGLGVEEQIESVVKRIAAISEAEPSQLNYNPVILKKKFNKTEQLILARIQGYVSLYYPIIRSCFHEMDGKDGFHFQILCEQIRACFIKMNDLTTDKSLIFTSIVEWIKRETMEQSTEACEAVASFFVQNCEVFYEITR